MLDLDIKHNAGALDLDMRFRTGGGITALFGPSGAGKTTLINAISGLLRPDTGQIRIGGQVLFDSTTGRFIPPERRRIGYVFQDPRLFPHLNVRRNLTYGARFAPKGATGPDFDQVTELLGITKLLDRRTADLSGGEKSRIAIGRALLAKPQLLLMDEPLAALDAPRRGEILPFLERVRDMGVPIIYVSHAMAEVARLADTVVLIKDGKVRATGTVSDLLSDPDLADFFGGSEAGAVIHATVSGQDADGMTRAHTSGGPVFLSEPHERGRQLRLRVQASDVIVSRDLPTGLSALNILHGRITRITPCPGIGPDRAWVQIDIGGEAVLAHVTQRSVGALDLQNGTECYAILKTVAVERSAAPQ
ncbi:molybdenum ABC transporter ATP-binding protein [Rhodobacteraceae bacterium]|nr:molybdenum ABC transporter ATP-binding protein [Paracoccaceae bacterium]